MLRAAGRTLTLDELLTEAKAVEGLAHVPIRMRSGLMIGSIEITAGEGIVLDDEADESDEMLGALLDFVESIADGSIKADGIKAHATALLAELENPEAA